MVGVGKFLEPIVTLQPLPAIRYVPGSLLPGFAEGYSSGIGVVTNAIGTGVVGVFADQPNRELPRIQGEAFQRVGYRTIDDKRVEVGGRGGPRATRTRHRFAQIPAIEVRQPLRLECRRITDCQEGSAQGGRQLGRPICVPPNLRSHEIGIPAATIDFFEGEKAIVPFEGMRVVQPVGQLRPKPFRRVVGVKHHLAQLEGIFHFAKGE